MTIPRENFCHSEGIKKGMEIQSADIASELGIVKTLPISIVQTLLNCVDQGLLISERSGRIVLANLKGRECLAALGHPEYRETNLISDVLKTQADSLLEKLEAGSAEVQLEIISGNNKFLATPQWIPEQEWVVLQFEPVVARASADAATQLTVQELLQEREITYRNLLAAYLKLQEVNRQKTVFLASAAHELKTPLAVIKGYYDLLLTGSLGRLTDKQKDILEKLVAEYPNDERAHFTLGNYYFGQQDFGPAIEHYKKATEIAPSYSPAYNILGYSYRQQGDYANAELAFKKYIELIPTDPNPYDSYAELLLKMGRFDDSIAQYRKALSIDPHFVPSHFGISADLLYMGKPSQADDELQQMANQARNDGETRTALFGMAVVAADSGKFDDAAKQMDTQYAVAEKKNDAAGMAGDLLAKGNILAEAAKYDAAKQQFDHSLQIMEASSLSQEIKDNAKLFHHFNLAGIDIAKKDYAAAKREADEFRQGAEASKNPAQLKQAHELAGRIALAQKDYDQAIAELQQANQQDPRNLFRLSQAYQGKGDDAKAKELCTKAAEFNSLPQLNYSFIRVKAQKMVAGKKA